MYEVRYSVFKECTNNVPLSDALRDIPLSKRLHDRIQCVKAEFGERFTKWSCERSFKEKKRRGRRWSEFSRLEQKIPTPRVPVLVQLISCPTLQRYVVH